MTDELHQRLQRLQHADDGDWGEVLRRAGRQRGRRRSVMAAVLVGVVAIAAPTALALRGSIVDFFQSDPAPQGIVLDFARLDIGAPRGMETEVIAEQTRKILVRRGYDGRVFTLYAAPSRKGGFCTYLDGGVGGGGCGPSYSVPVAPEIGIRGPITPDGVIHGGPVVVSGSVGLDDADAIELRYEDGAADRQTLTWISKPIGAAFFVFDVEPAHWAHDRQPNVLVVLDPDGRRLRTEPLHFRTHPMPDLETGVPSEALVDQGRKLITVHTHTGVEASLWVAPTADGRSCYWLRYGQGGFGGGCPARESERPFGLGRSQGDGVVLLWGGPLRQDIAEVEVRYQDGERDLVRVAEGMALWELRPAHFPRGHRAKMLTARDAEGHAVARQRLETDNPGEYPCKKPVALGAGVKACP
jgi:hypothetical protein